MPLSGSLPKVLFVGDGRAGKDEAASTIARITKLQYAGSFSWAVLPLIAHALDIHPQIAWDTRRANRQFWYEFCNDLRKNDPSLLARMVLENGEVTAGMRDKVELEAVKREALFNHIIWVSRPGTPRDPTITFGPDDCDGTIRNGGTLEEFHITLFEWAVDNKIPLKRNDESVKLFRASKFYAWGNDKPALAPFESPFVPVVVKPFELGNE